MRRLLIVIALANVVGCGRDDRYTDHEPPPSGPGVSKDAGRAPYDPPPSGPGGGSACVTADVVAIDQVRTVEDHLATATRPADGTETHLLTCEGMARWADGFQRPVRLVLTIDSDNQTWIDEAWDESPTGSA